MTALSVFAVIAYVVLGVVFLGFYHGALAPGARGEEAFFVWLLWPVVLVALMGVCAVSLLCGLHDKVEQYTREASR